VKNILSLIFICSAILIAIPVFAQKTSKKPTPEKKPTPANNQTIKPTSGVNIVREGKGIEGIVVGVSSMDDVEKKFGKSYKLTAHKKYSYQMYYGALGLSFYSCQSDKKKQIFVIEIKSPYKAKTSRGITLGESTVEDIQRIYGKKKEGLEYRGVGFYYNTIGGKKIVTEIDVIENFGIRQCKVSKKDVVK